MDPLLLFLVICKFFHREHSDLFIHFLDCHSCGVLALASNVLFLGYDHVKVANLLLVFLHDHGRRNFLLLQDEIR